MKKIVIACMVIAFAMACTPDTPKPIGPRYTTSEGVEGVWTIGKVEVVDESSPLKLTRDVTDYFSTVAPNVSMNFDVATGTFVTTNAGDGINYFGNSGALAFDNDEFPTKLYLVESADTTTFSFVRAPRAIDPIMVVKHNRNACDKVYVNYQFTLTRTQ